MFKLFYHFKSLEKSFITAITLLPLAAVSLRLGVLFDNHLFIAFGNTIYQNIGLIFAVSIAYGFTQDAQGIASLAGVICYLVLKDTSALIEGNIDTGVLGGILSGFTASIVCNLSTNRAVYQKFPFIANRILSPVIASIAMLPISLIYTQAWKVINLLLMKAALTIDSLGYTGSFLYGTLNRLLLPLGLHHTLNNHLWYDLGDYNGIHGDLNRFFAGDPTAGTFMAGFFPIMMFGLPAIVFAFNSSITGIKRFKALKILFVGAAVSFFTGITEPIELTFMFLMPGLYVIHALLTGLSLMICDMMGIKAGFDFSAGFLDYVAHYSLGTNNILIIPVGIGFAFLYYRIFKYVITTYHLPVIGLNRAFVPQSESEWHDYIHDLLNAFGGTANISDMDYRISRINVMVKDGRDIDFKTLKLLGFEDIFRFNETHFQLIIRPDYNELIPIMRKSLKFD